MTKRRAYGDGGLYWNERRQRWIATVTVGYDGRGKRMVKTGSGRTKTEAKQKLREQLRDHEDGLALGRDDYTVGHAVEDWLAYGLGRQGPATITKYRIFCGKHIIPLLGARKLRDLTAREVDAWLFELSKSLSTATLQRVRSCLNRAVKRAMARDLVKRNVVELTEVPTGRAGRRSKSLTPKQVDDVLTKTATEQATHIHRGVAADWWPNRGASGAALGACAPRGGWVVAAARGGVAVRTSRWRHQNQEVPADACPSRAVHRGTMQAASAAGCRPVVGRRTVARDRSGVHHVGRNQDARG